MGIGLDPSALAKIGGWVLVRKKGGGETHVKQAATQEDTYNKGVGKRNCSGQRVHCRRNEVHGETGTCPWQRRPGGASLRWQLWIPDPQEEIHKHEEVKFSAPGRGWSTAEAESQKKGPTVMAEARRQRGKCQKHSGGARIRKSLSGFRLCHESHPKALH